MFRSIARLLLIPMLIVFTMSAGDALLMARPASIPHVLWAFVDAPVHAILALLVVTPLLVQRPLWRVSIKLPSQLPSQRSATIFATLVVVAAAALIDIDHFIAARSFSLEAALDLPMRPPSHSLSFAFAVACAVWLTTRRLTAGYLVFAALASHVLRDASGGGTPIIWPFPLYHLAPSLCVAFLILLLLGSELLAGARRSGCWQLRVHSCPVIQNVDKTR